MEVHRCKERSWGRGKGLVTGSWQVAGPDHPPPSVGWGTVGALEAKGEMIEMKLAGHVLVQNMCAKCECVNPCDKHLRGKKTVRMPGGRGQVRVKTCPVHKGLGWIGMEVHNDNGEY